MLNNPGAGAGSFQTSTLQAGFAGMMSKAREKRDREPDYTPQHHDAAVPASSDRTPTHGHADLDPSKGKRRRKSVASMIHKSAAEAEHAALIGAATSAAVAGDRSAGEKRLQILLGAASRGPISTHSRMGPGAGAGLKLGGWGGGLARFRNAASKIQPKGMFISNDARLKLFLGHIVWPCTQRRYEAQGGCLLWDAALSRLTPEAGARLRRLQISRLPKHFLDGTQSLETIGHKGGSGSGSGAVGTMDQPSKNASALDHGG